MFIHVNIQLSTHHQIHINQYIGYHVLSIVNQLFYTSNAPVPHCRWCVCHSETNRAHISGVPPCQKQDGDWYNKHLSRSPHQTIYLKHVETSWFCFDTWLTIEDAQHWLVNEVVLLLSRFDLIRAIGAANIGKQMCTCVGMM